MKFRKTMRPPSGFIAFLFVISSIGQIQGCSGSSGQNPGDAADADVGAEAEALLQRINDGLSNDPQLLSRVAAAAQMAMLVPAASHSEPSLTVHDLASRLQSSYGSNAAFLGAFGVRLNNVSDVEVYHALLASRLSKPGHLGVFSSYTYEDRLQVLASTIKVKLYLESIRSLVRSSTSSLPLTEDPSASSELVGNGATVTIPDKPLLMSSGHYYLEADIDTAKGGQEKEYVDVGGTPAHKARCAKHLRTKDGNSEDCGN